MENIFEMMKNSIESVCAVVYNYIYCGEHSRKKGAKRK